MGYYSDVRVSTTQEGFEFLKAHVDEKHELFGGYGYVEDVNDEKGVVFGWSWVKWYSSFSDVMAFEQALHEAYEAGIQYEYMVLGEEGDHEFSSSDENDEITYHLEIEMHVSYWS